MWSFWSFVGVAFESWFFMFSSCCFTVVYFQLPVVVVTTAATVIARAARESNLANQPASQPGKAFARSKAGHMIITEEPTAWCEVRTKAAQWESFKLINWQVSFSLPLSYSGARLTMVKFEPHSQLIFPLLLLRPPLFWFRIKFRSGREIERCSLSGEAEIVS